MKKMKLLFAMLAFAALVNTTTPVMAQTTSDNTTTMTGADMDDADDDDGGRWGLAGLLGLLGLLGLRRRDHDHTHTVRGTTNTNR